MSSRLAIDGGTPVRATPLPYGRQAIDEDDIEAVVSVLRSDWLTTGPAVQEFERRLQSVTGAPAAVAIANGTAALHAAMHALGVGPGDEVIVPANTFAASANAARYMGARPVFADVDPDTLLLPPDEVGRLVSDRTRVVVAVDYAGQPCDYDELRSVCERHGLALIADAAHSLGASYKGQPVGNLADLTTFSFHPVKHITTAEGGAVTTSDLELASSVRRFRNHGITTEQGQRTSWTYEMVDLGFNYRLSDLQCALGTSQLTRLPDWIERRRDLANRYRKAFSDLPEVSPLAVVGDRQSSWHLFVVRLDLSRLRVDRGAVFRALRAENIGVNVHYIPVPWHPYYQDLGYGKGNWPVAESTYERMLTLPLFPGMTASDFNDVVEAVERVISTYRA